MTHQDFQVYATIVNHTGMWVQAIGLFAQATCAPEFGLPKPFN